MVKSISFKNSIGVLTGKQDISYPFSLEFIVVILGCFLTMRITVHV